MTRAQIDSNLKHAIAAGTPVEIVDPATQTVYYLVSAEEFARIAQQGESDVDPRIVYPLIDAVMSEDDAADPLLESYQ